MSDFLCFARSALLPNQSACFSFVQRRRDPECLYSDCERMLTHSSQLLERARNSLGRSPQFSQDSHSQDAVDGGIVVPSHAEVANKSLDAFDGGDVAPSHTEAPNDVAELEREFSRQKEWLQACENNLTYLDHLKESLTDSGVEDDLDPIRQQVRRKDNQKRQIGCKISGLSVGRSNISTRSGFPSRRRLWLAWV